MDNSLISTNPVYMKSNLENATSIKEKLNLQETIEEILETMNTVDIGNITKMGFSPNRYIQSWIQTYEFYCEKMGAFPTGDHKEEIIKTAQIVFETKIPVFPNTYETLEYLKTKGYTLHLLTLGDEEVQTKRIEDAKLKEYFHDIHIVPQKNTDALMELMKQKGENPEHLIMIGDSLKGDIKPALEVGMKAIHIQKENWVYDQCDVDINHPNYSSIQHIEELQNIFK